jgi:hypothetical protein
VLGLYDKIKVYKSSSVNGSYAEITNSGTRVALNVQDTLYSYTDNAGLSSDWYKTSYFNSGNNAESNLSNPVQGLIDNSIQLTENMQVVINLSGDIKGLNGASLGDQTFYFTTSYDPLYSSIRKLRLEIGAFIQNQSDDSLNLALFEASLAADEMTWIEPKPSAADKFYNFVRREWTTCKAAQDLLFNVISGLKSKRLDNFEVTYDFQKRGQAMLDKIDACLAKWEPQLKSGGHATQTPSAVVKGEFDPDAPHVGRLWEKGPYTRPISGANLRYRPCGSRRYISGWKQRMTWTRFG